MNDRNRNPALTDAWRYYEKGRLYNNSLEPNQYRLVNTNLEFFSGNQWINMPETDALKRLPRPTFNIIKRVASLFIASLTSGNTTISFSTLSYKDDGIRREDPSAPEPSVFATAEVRNLLEKFKMEYRIRDALYDGAITGDYCAHFFWNPEALPYGGAFSPYKGEIEMELVDGINVMFGNPNCPDVEKQPYILIVGRDTVSNLKREARLRNAPNADAIRPDSDVADMPGSGGRTELGSGEDDLSAKCLYVYMYRKVYEEVTFTEAETGRTETRYQPNILVTKATRNCEIFRDVPTGLSRYPIAWGNWEKQKNQYHGRALVTGIVPNQISVNLMMAMTILHTELESFPVRLFNADLIPGLSNEIGQAIGVRNLAPGEDLRQVIATVPPADMSGQILAAIDRVMEYTKECLGATDAQLGSVQPENTSALMVLQSSAEVPLENIRAGLHEWIEDIGAILLDMMGTYYGKRPIVREGVMEEFDFSVFKRLWLNVSADVGATTYYSEIAMVQTLDNLRRDGTLDVIDYLERLPDKLIPCREELVEKLKAAREFSPAAPDAAAAAANQDVRYAMGGPLDEAKKIANLPTSIQAKYNSLPKVAQRAVIR